MIIHARMAWLSGLSPKENRDIPPLDYDLVHKMEAENPDLQIIINGGLDSLDVAMDHINNGLDGAMIGRAAWHNPFALLATADQLAFGAPAPDTAPLPASNRPCDAALYPCPVGRWRADDRARASYAGAFHRDARREDVAEDTVRMRPFG